MPQKLIYHLEERQPRTTYSIDDYGSDERPVSLSVTWNGRSLELVGTYTRTEEDTSNLKLHFANCGPNHSLYNLAFNHRIHKGRFPESYWDEAEIDRCISDITKLQLGYSSDAWGEGAAGNSKERGVFLREVADEIERVYDKGLETLTLSKHQLHSVPEFTFRAIGSTLTYIDLSMNRFSYLPYHIKECRALHAIDLSHNRFENPDELLGLNEVPALKVVDLRFNQLKAKPRLSDQIKVDVTFNPLRL